MPVTLVRCLFISCCKLPPKLIYTNAIGWEHAVLQAVEISPVDRRHKLTRSKTEEDARRQVVLPYAGAEFEIRLEHRTEGQRDGLRCLEVLRDVELW